MAPVEEWVKVLNLLHRDDAALTVSNYNDILTALAPMLVTTPRPSRCSAPCLQRHHLPMGQCPSALRRRKPPPLFLPAAFPTPTPYSSAPSIASLIP